MEMCIGSETLIAHPVMIHANETIWQIGFFDVQYFNPAQLANSYADDTNVTQNGVKSRL